jgi:8-oxo-dGTP pyrophosphatase MutT (NUDIX family)
MGHPPGAVTLPCPAYADLAPAVERIGPWWGAAPGELAALLRRPGSPTTDQLAAIAWVLDPSDRRLLLVDHRAYGWSCPGGHVEHGETPAAAATRELAEETGLRLAPSSDEPVTLTVVDAPADTAGPGHRHWILGYRFTADPAAALTIERDPVDWHDVAALPARIVVDLPPLLDAMLR